MHQSNKSWMEKKTPVRFPEYFRLLKMTSQCREHLICHRMMTSDGIWGTTGGVYLAGCDVLHTKLMLSFFVSPPRWKEKWNCHKFKHCQSYLLGKDFFLYVYLLFCCYCCCCCSQEFTCWKFANSSCNFLSGSGSCPKRKFHLMVYHSIRLSPMSSAGGSLWFFNPSTHPANRLTGCVVPLLGAYFPNKIYNNESLQTVLGGPMVGPPHIPKSFQCLFPLPF